MIPLGEAETSIFLPSQESSLQLGIGQGGGGIPGPHPPLSGAFLKSTVLQSLLKSVVGLFLLWTDKGLHCLEVGNTHPTDKQG